MEIGVRNEYDRNGLDEDTENIRKSDHKAMKNVSSWMTESIRICLEQGAFPCLQQSTPSAKDATSDIISVTAV